MDVLAFIPDQAQAGADDKSAADGALKQAVLCSGCEGWMLLALQCALEAALPVQHCTPSTLCSPLTFLLYCPPSRRPWHLGAPAGSRSAGPHAPHRQPGARHGTARQVRMLWLHSMDCICASPPAWRRHGAARPVRCVYTASWHAQRARGNGVLTVAQIVLRQSPPPGCLPACIATAGEPSLLQSGTQLRRRWRAVRGRRLPSGGWPAGCTPATRCALHCSVRDTRNQCTEAR